MNERTVRTATAADAPRVAEIYAGQVRTGVATFDLVPPPVDTWAEKIRAVQRDGWPFLVATSAGVVVGFAYATQWRPKPGYRFTAEDTVYVSPDFVGRGIGRALLSRLLADCGAAGARQMIAVIADSGDPASVALHRSLGFREVGRLQSVGTKFGREIDTVLLQRGLTSPDTQPSGEADATTSR
jgi:phosphinothricin acetyltransferase